MGVCREQFGQAAGLLWRSGRGTHRARPPGRLRLPLVLPPTGGHGGLLWHREEVGQTGPGQGGLQGASGGSSSGDGNAGRQVPWLQGTRS